MSVNQGNIGVSFQNQEPLYFRATLT